MDIALNTEQTEFASKIADGMINGESLERSSLSESEKTLVIAELRKDLDIQFALKLIKGGTSINEVDDIANQRHYMVLALSIIKIEAS